MTEELGKGEEGNQRRRQDKWGEKVERVSVRVGGRGRTGRKTWKTRREGRGRASGCPKNASE